MHDLLWFFVAALKPLPEEEEEEEKDDQHKDKQKDAKKDLEVNSQYISCIIYSKQLYFVSVKTCLTFVLINNNFLILFLEVV